MKKTKKYPKVNLENYSKLFMQLGLVLALFIAYVTIEQKTLQKPIVVHESNTESALLYLFDETPKIFVKEVIKPKVQKPIVKPLILDIDKFIKDDANLKETFIDIPIDNTPIDNQVREIIEIPDDEPIIKEDVPFVLIEDVPVFPGCKGDRAALTKCFSQKVQKHFARKFDAELPSELGLSSGKKRVHIGFKIDKFGNVIDIQALAPHPKIKKEVIKVMQLLPKMQPGKQRGTPVGVKYAIPLKILVE